MTESEESKESSPGAGFLPSRLRAASRAGMWWWWGKSQNNDFSVSHRVALKVSPAATVNLLPPPSSPRWRLGRVAPGAGPPLHTPKQSALVLLSQQSCLCTPPASVSETEPETGRRPIGLGSLCSVAVVVTTLCSPTCELLLCSFVRVSTFSLWFEFFEFKQKIHGGPGDLDAQWIVKRSLALIGLKCSLHSSY